MVGHIRPGAAAGWLMIEPGSIRVVGDAPDGKQILRDAEHGGPSFLCRAWFSLREVIGQQFIQSPWVMPTCTRRC